MFLYREKYTQQCNTLNVSNKCFRSLAVPRLSYRLPLHVVEDFYFIFENPPSLSIIHITLWIGILALV